MLEFEWLFNQGALEINPICQPSAVTFSGVQTNELEDATEFLQKDYVVLTIAVDFAKCDDELAGYLAHLAGACSVSVGLVIGVLMLASWSSVFTHSQVLGDLS